MVVTLSALALALFRLGTNNVLLWSALPLTYGWVSLIREKVCGETYDRSKFRLSPSRYTTQDIHFLENLILFNNIIIPGLAIVFTLPDCFYNALFAANSVSSSYNYQSCEQYIPLLGYRSGCSEQSKTLNYDPPYIYSFQCSSKIVINYMVVYVIMFILAGFLIPLMKVSLKLLSDKLKVREFDLSPISSSIRETPWVSLQSWLRRTIRGALPQYFKDFAANCGTEDETGKSALSSLMESLFRSQHGMQEKGDSVV